MDLRVHLKVCEGCGSLWYRSQFEAGVYCASCDRRFQEFPAPQSRKRRGRPRKAILPTVHAVEDTARNSTSTTSHTSAISGQSHHLRTTPPGSWGMSKPPHKPVTGIRSLSSHHSDAHKQESAATLAKGGAQ